MGNAEDREEAEAGAGAAGCAERRGSPLRCRPGRGVLTGTRGLSCWQEGLGPGRSSPRSAQGVRESLGHLRGVWVWSLRLGERRLGTECLDRAANVTFFPVSVPRPPPPRPVPCCLARTQHARRSRVWRQAQGFVGVLSQAEDVPARAWEGTLIRIRRFPPLLAGPSRWPRQCAASSEGGGGQS